MSLAMVDVDMVTVDRTNIAEGRRMLVQSVSTYHANKGETMTDLI